MPAPAELSTDTLLYAAAYRPVLREERPEIDIWTAPCALGAALPLLPLRLTGDLFVPVDFESTVEDDGHSRRQPLCGYPLLLL